jgi:hypothetical protein
MHGWAYEPGVGNLPPSRAGAVGLTDPEGSFWLFSEETIEIDNLQLSMEFTALNDFWMLKPSAVTLPPAPAPSVVPAAGARAAGR